MNLVQYFLAFMFFSFVGWVYETLLYTIQERKFISSGFLFGPYCPIYGGGAVLMVFCFYGRTENPWVIFFGGMILATVVEYLTAVVLEKRFHKKWWDYSNIRFNYQGRICLLGALCFGSMCLLLCKLVQPLFYRIIVHIPEDIQFWVAVSLAIMFLIDYIATLINLKLKKNKAVENADNNNGKYENELPQLNIQVLFSYIGLKGKFKFKLKDKVHFGGISYIIEKLKLKPFYIEKVEPFYEVHIEPIKEKLQNISNK